MKDNPTVAEALGLPAGRELDALVAVHVMGCQLWDEAQWIKSTEPGSTIVQEWWLPETGERIVYEGPYPVKEEWHFSEDMNAAWQVVEKLQSEGYSTHIGTQNNGHAWTMQVNKGSLDNCHHGHGETAPLAIVRCALKALWKD